MAYDAITDPPDESTLKTIALISSSFFIFLSVSVTFLAIGLIILPVTCTTAIFSFSDLYLFAEYSSYFWTKKFTRGKRSRRLRTKHA